ncbi:MAG: winged helix-turn-helix transcriptional regulator [Clostridiales bacterium]|jgi:ArsR family transcriptional regulator|nr:winged helix-turn-helix transcriptional regulator [Clostridiales bacterium]
MDKRYYNTARVFKALCDENRVRILEMLQTGEKCACHLLEALRVTQPTLSHHMRILCDSGIVESRREGKWTYYKISASGVAGAFNLLNEVTKQK